MPFHAATLPSEEFTKWGVDELLGELVRPVVLKHREIYGTVSKRLPTSQKTWESFLFVSIHFHCHHLVVIPMVSGLDLPM